tara:strand:+ start:1223 stop:2803 length:1581 start_codon:yes stop_codon:yes gene_type:complete
MKSYDVAIIGYGPTGAMMASLLGKQGINTLVVEPNMDIYEIPRAVHYDGEVMRIFQSQGLHERIKEAGREPGFISFLNGFNWTLLHQDLSESDRVHYWANSTFFSQPQLEKYLRETVDDCNSVDQFLGWQLEELYEDSSGVTLKITDINGTDSQHVQCSYLLGCDGASSSTRELGGFELQDLGCDEPWLVCDLILDKSIQIKDEAYQICDPTRPTSLIPCEPGHIRWEFMLNDTDDHGDVENEDNVRALMAPHIGRLNSQLNERDGSLIRAKVYRFHALLADQFKKGRVFLLGDAAHQMPPFLGQGLCSGIRDAYNLNWKLAGVLSGQWDARILDSYHSERRPHVEEVIKLAITHGDIIQTRNPLKALARDLFLMLGRLIPILVSSIKFGQQWRLGDGIFAQDPHSLDRYMLRQSMVTLSNGDCVLLDSLLDNEFSVVGFNTDLAPLLSQQNTDFLQTPLAGFNLGDQGQGIDKEGLLQRWAEDNNVALALLRPDRQIYGLCYTDSSESLKDQLGKLIDQLKIQLT